MNKAQIKKMHALLLEDLKVFDAFCMKHHIDYFINSGTLLGAIRHQGFIPWDDDLDIGLTRENYNKLLLAFNSYPGKHYVLLNYKNDPHMPTIYSHLIDKRAKFYQNKSGNNNDYLHLDIYVCDYIDNTRFAHSKVGQWVELLLNRLYAYRKGHVSVDNKNRVLKLLLLKIGNYVLRKKSDEEMVQLILNLVRSGTDKGFMAPIASPYGFQKEMFPTKCYTELERHSFEDTEVLIPKHYDQLLTQVYGDYMTLPPEESRYGSLDKYTFEMVSTV